MEFGSFPGSPETEVNKPGKSKGRGQRDTDLDRKWVRNFLKMQRDEGGVSN